MSVGAAANLVVVNDAVPDDRENVVARRRHAGAKDVRSIGLAQERVLGVLPTDVPREPDQQTMLVLQLHLAPLQCPQRLSARHPRARATKLQATVTLLLSSGLGAVAMSVLLPSH
jgi:hypothetical protein